MTTVVVLNPRAGGVGTVPRLMRKLREHPSLADPEILLTRGPGDGFELAREHAADTDRIVVVGGDGTFNEVASGVLDAVGPGDGPVLGLIPAGTGNDLARSLGLPRSVGGALRALDDWAPASVDALRMSRPRERWVFNASAGGFGGKVDEAMDHDLKKSWGPLAYLRGALDVLPDPPRYRTSLLLDEGLETEARLEMDAANVVVANGRTAARGVPVAPAALLDDGVADLVVFRPGEPSRMIAAVASGALPGPEMDHDLVEHRRVRTVRLDAEPAMPFNADGELVGESPLELRVIPGALRVLTPGGPKAALSPPG